MSNATKAPTKRKGRKTPTTPKAMPKTTKAKAKAKAKAPKGPEALGAPTMTEEEWKAKAAEEKAAAKEEKAAAKAARIETNKRTTSVTGATEGLRHRRSREDWKLSTLRVGRALLDAAGLADLRFEFGSVGREIVGGIGTEDCGEDGPSAGFARNSVGKVLMHTKPICVTVLPLPDGLSPDTVGASSRAVARGHWSHLVWQIAKRAPKRERRAFLASVTRSKFVVTDEVWERFMESGVLPSSAVPRSVATIEEKEDGSVTFGLGCLFPHGYKPEPKSKVETVSCPGINVKDLTPEEVGHLRGLLDTLVPDGNGKADRQRPERPARPSLASFSGRAPDSGPSGRPTLTLRR
jgi:hypothetical protein